MNPPISPLPWEVSESGTHIRDANGDYVGDSADSIVNLAYIVSTVNALPSLVNALQAAAAALRGARQFIGPPWHGAAAFTRAENEKVLTQIAAALQLVTGSVEPAGMEVTSKDCDPTWDPVLFSIGEPGHPDHPDHPG